MAVFADPFAFAAGKGLAMLGTSFSRLRFQLTSVYPQHGDQVKIVVAAVIVMGVMFAVQLDRGRSTASAVTAPQFVIDPNTASEAELLLLPRVGPSLAGAIMRERETRAFESAEEISRTRGIGNKTLVKILPHLRMSEKSSR